MAARHTSVDAWLLCSPAYTHQADKPCSQAPKAQPEQLHVHSTRLLSLLVEVPGPQNAEIQRRALGGSEDLVRGF